MAYLLIFFISFLSATLYPLASEAFVLGAIIEGLDAFYIFLLATLGNSLGSISTYALAFFGKKYILERYFANSLKRLEGLNLNANKFGIIIAFFCFLPIVGDIFALYLGFVRYSFILSCIFITLGKATRYAVIITLALYFSS